MPVTHNAGWFTVPSFRAFFSSVLLCIAVLQIANSVMFCSLQIALDLLFVWHNGTAKVVRIDKIKLFSGFRIIWKLLHDQANYDSWMYAVKSNDWVHL